MKQFFYIAGAMLLLTATMNSCKTSEENYKAAYEIAKQHDNEGLDATVYANIRNEARNNNVTVGSEKMPVRTEYVSIVSDQAPEGAQLMPRNIVVAQFKQLFNAKSLRQRLIANGYPDALIIQTREPLYYVVAAACSTNEEALRLLQEVEKRKDIPMKDPYPLVVCPARKR